MQCKISLSLFLSISLSLSRSLARSISLYPCLSVFSFHHLRLRLFFFSVSKNFIHRGRRGGKRGVINKVKEGFQIEIGLRHSGLSVEIDEIIGLNEEERIVPIARRKCNLLRRNSRPKFSFLRSLLFLSSLLSHFLFFFFLSMRSLEIIRALRFRD